MRHDHCAFVDQIFGENKLFGYENAIINQIRLISWFSGEFYFSKVFTRRIQWFWISFNFLSASIVIYHSLSYILFATHLDMSTLLTCNEVLITMLSLLVLVPIGSYLYQKSVVDTLKSLDELSLRELNSASNAEISTNTRKYTWTEAYAAGFTQMFFCTAFIISTYYDLIMEFDKGKLTSTYYYIFPLYCENTDTLSEFFFATYLQFVACVPISTMYFIFPFFSIIVMKEFNSKFQILSDFLNYKSKLFERDYEKIMTIDHHDDHPVNVKKLLLEDSILNDIHSCAKYHHHLLRGLTHLRLYIEYNMSISLFFFLYIEIFLIYLFTLMKDDQIIQKARYIEHAMVICILFVVNCWVGSSYTDMGNTFNDQVYNIPWYYLSPSARKSVHLLLYQARVTIQFEAWKIYPLNMAFFMRSCNNVYSIVNLIRRAITYKF